MTHRVSDARRTTYDARPSYRPPLEKEGEHRDADEGSDHTHRQLARRHDGASQRVGKREQRAAAEKGGREQGPVPVAPREPRDVRYDQPDETDDPGDRYGGSRE